MRPRGNQKEEPQKVRRSARLIGISRLRKSENGTPGQRHSSVSTEEVRIHSFNILPRANLTCRVIESPVSTTIEGPKATPRGGAPGESHIDRAASKTSSTFTRGPFSRADVRSRGSQCYQRISEESYQSLGREKILAKGVLSAGQYASPDCETEINGFSST